jgi:hypothetical protein
MSFPCVVPKLGSSEKRISSQFGIHPLNGRRQDQDLPMSIVDLMVADRVYWRRVSDS